MNAGTKISYSDLKTLADLATSKLSPAAPYSFSAFAGSDKIGLPDDISIAATYGTGTIDAGSKITFSLYAYKTIDGLKTYTLARILKAFQGEVALGVFELTWSWVSAIDATAPDGYIVAIPRNGPNWVHIWQDIGNVETFTWDGIFSNPPWKTDSTIDADNFGAPDDNLPCGRGAWLKSINHLRQGICLLTDIGCSNSGDVTGLDNIGGVPASRPIETLGIAGLVSGPWCVSVSGGAGANALQSWVSRSSIYIQPAEATGFFPCFTQCYRNIKFYFRAADGPDVNITAQNQLVNYRIGSDVIVDSTGHWHLVVVSCSTGHIKAQDSGGGAVRVDLDVVAGNTYDLSFDITGIGPIFLGKSVPLDLDFTFTTDAATGTGVDAAGIEFENDVKSIDVPDSYCEIEFNNIVTYNTPGHIPIQLCTTCLKLTLTEQNNTPGVWVATTLPTLGVMKWLDVDLPQYSPSETFPASTQRTPRDSALPYIPVVDDLGAMWPCFRDTDFTPDDVAGKPITGSAAWQKIISTKKPYKSQSTDDIPSAAISGTLWNFSIFVTDGAQEVRFFADSPEVVIYAKAGGFPTLLDFDITGPGGSWLTLPPGFLDDTAWFYSIYNPTAGTLTVNTAAVVITSGPAPLGTFFPTRPDDDGDDVPKREGFSYHFSDPESVAALPIPMFGYCVYRLTARRMGETSADLTVRLGVMKGFSFNAAGTFTELATLTILAGQTFSTADVFLPVLSGTPLAYKCSEVLVIKSSVNFQPMMHSTFQPRTVLVSGSDYAIGDYAGPAWYQFNRALLSFRAVSNNPLLLPATADIYNDTVAVLNALP